MGVPGVAPLLGGAQGAGCAGNSTQALPSSAWADRPVPACSAGVPETHGPSPCAPQLRLCWDPLPLQQQSLGGTGGPRQSRGLGGTPAPQQHHRGGLSSPGDEEPPVPPTPVRFQASVKPPWPGGKRQPLGTRGRPTQPRQPVGAGRRGHPTALLAFTRPLNGRIVRAGVVRRPAATSGLASPPGMRGEGSRPKQGGHSGQETGSTGHPNSNPEQGPPPTWGDPSGPRLPACPQRPGCGGEGALQHRPSQYCPSQIPRGTSWEPVLQRGASGCRARRPAGLAVKGSAGTRARLSALGDVGGLPRRLEEEVQLL